VLVDDVWKTFGKPPKAVEALRGISLEVQRGQVLGVLGPNGAGKTTAVRVLTTLIKPDRGRAEVEGIDVVRRPAEVRKVIGLAGQFAAVDENLTGRENVEMVGRLYHLGPKVARRRAGEVLERLRLSDAADRPVRTYSGGMRRRLDLGASLVAQPRVLLLDEPTTGLDPRSRAELWEFIRDLVSDGATVLLTTQYLEEADQLADSIVVVDHGTVIARGTSQELKDSIGGDLIAVEVAPEQVDNAIAALAGLGHQQAHREEQSGASGSGASGIVALPAGQDGAGLVSELVRRLDAAQLPILGLELRRPSLDDVFLSLTGRPAEGAENGDSSPAADGSTVAAKRQDDERRVIEKEPV
jgi:ABC-2 type transport system ATP-binding protein